MTRYVKIGKMAHLKSESSSNVPWDAALFAFSWKVLPDFFPTATESSRDVHDLLHEFGKGMDKNLDFINSCPGRRVWLWSFWFLYIISPKQRLKLCFFAPQYWKIWGLIICDVLDNSSTLSTLTNVIFCSQLSLRCQLGNLEMKTSVQRKYYYIVRVSLEEVPSLDPP